MSTEVITVTAQNSLCQEYATEWKVTHFSLMNPKGIRTPVFSPLSNIDATFYIEIWYQEISSGKSRDEISSFKVALVKLPSSDIQLPLKLEFKVTVNYTDGTLFKKYSCLSGIDINKMDSVTCINDISQFYIEPGTCNAYLSNHGINIRKNALILKLWMKFYGHLSTPSVYCHDIRSLNNLKKFAKDFRSLVEPSVLSDIIIQVGEKYLQAHRAVLAAHSPVFKKMMESDFLESKTNIITISDFSCDILECFLKYLYSGEIEDKSWSNIRELYTLADKYDVEALKGECAKIIGSFFTVDQACDILKIAYDCNDSELKEEAKRFAVVHFHEIVRRAEWYALVTSHPTAVSEVMASVYLVPKNVLENKETATSESSSNEILPEKNNLNVFSLS